jgi:ribokinase
MFVPHFPDPGETVQGHSVTTGPGGKGLNQAIAAALAGAKCHIIGAVGADPVGKYLMSQLRERGVITDAVTIDQAVPTGIAYITVEDSGENHIVFVSGANTCLRRAGLERHKALIAAADVIVVQGELASETTSAAVHLAGYLGRRTIINAAPVQQLEPSVLALADPLVVNEVEAAELLSGTAVDSVDAALTALPRLINLAKSAVITLGGDGAVVSDRNGRTTHVPAVPVEAAIDTSGAGDAFVGVLAAGLAFGLPLEAAVRAGGRAGADVVTRRGCSLAYRDFSAFLG